MQDNVSRKEALELLKDDENAVLIGNLWGYITNVNKNAVKFFGAKNKSEFIGKHVVNFLVEEERERAVKNSINSIAKNKGIKQTYKIRLKNGETIDLEVQTMLITNEKGEQTGFVDIIKQNENLKSEP